MRWRLLLLTWWVAAARLVSLWRSPICATDAMHCQCVQPRLVLSPPFLAWCLSVCLSAKLSSAALLSFMHAFIRTRSRQRLQLRWFISLSVMAIEILWLTSSLYLQLPRTLTVYVGLGLKEWWMDKFSLNLIEHATWLAWKHHFMCIKTPVDKLIFCIWPTWFFNFTLLYYIDMAIDIRLGYDVYFYKNRKKAVRPWAVDDGKYRSWNVSCRL